MTAKNDITGADLVSKAATKSYQDGWERIFGKKKSEAEQEIKQMLLPGNDEGEPTREYVDQDR